MGDIVNLAAERFARGPMTEEKAKVIIRGWLSQITASVPADRVPAKGAEHLLAWRHRTGWTARDVSYALGKGPDWVRGVESGRRFLRMQDAAALAKLYGITVEDLMKAPPA